MSTIDEAVPLCAACNMCCDGTLFTHARLQPGEEGQALAAGLEVFDADGRPAIPLPCPMVTSGGCSVYEIRPDKCRRFRCETLKALDSGGIDRREGGRRVEQVRETIAHVVQVFGLDSLVEVRNQLAAGLRPDPAQSLALARLQLLFDRYFLRPDKRVLDRPGH